MVSQRRKPSSFATLGDMEAAARAAVDDGVWGYIQGGAGAERTVRANEAAFDRWVLLPEILRDVRSVDLSATLLGQRVSAPFFVAPTAYHREVHRGGERATAAAAGALGVLGVYSTLSSDSLETIAQASGSGPKWFQLYLQPRLEDSIALVARAERAGFGALVITVDTPILGTRDRQIRSGFAVRRNPVVGNGATVMTPARGPSWDGSALVLEDSAEVSWAAVDAVRRATALPLVIKGVLRPEAARRAVEAGAKAIVVSNHGGRQLDQAPGALDALPGIVDAVGRDAEVYLDGGVRRGSDIIVALALGARAVGLGRPVLWALAAEGGTGVDRYLRLLGTELANAMIQVGRGSPAEVDRSVVRAAPSGPSGSAAPHLPRALHRPSGGGRAEHEPGRPR